MVSIPRRPIRLGPGRSTPHPSDAPATKHAPATPIPSGVELQLPGPCALHPQGLLGTVVPGGWGVQPGLWAVSLGSLSQHRSPVTVRSSTQVYGAPAVSGQELFSGKRRKVTVLSLLYTTAGGSYLPHFLTVLVQWELVGLHRR